MLRWLYFTEMNQTVEPPEWKTHRAGPREDQQIILWPSDTHIHSAARYGANTLYTCFYTRPFRCNIVCWPICQKCSFISKHLSQEHLINKEKGLCKYLHIKKKSKIHNPSWHAPIMNIIRCIRLVSVMNSWVNNSMTHSKPTKRRLSPPTGVTCRIDCFLTNTVYSAY